MQLIRGNDYMESYEILWKTALPELEKTISSISYDTYITHITPVDVIGNRLILCTESAMFADQINSRLRQKITEALSKSNPDVNEFQVVVAKDRDEYVKKIAEDAGGSIDNASSPINPKFTFESFVVGSSNEFSYHAAKAVCDNPGDAYNPLFIYGGTGLGKTHLLMAIANHIKLHKPSLKVLYATCEQFINQMVESLSKGKLTPQDFRNKFRNVDVLLIDDVQFLSKKQATQVEFFHTFNELVMLNKQVVLASDRPPEEIEFLEERLKTRFSGGLLADVQTPDIETRIAILRKKSEEQKCLVDIKVLSYIAETSDADIRTLIGKLTKVIFASKLHERPITIELVKEALKESASEKQEELKVEDIINCVCSFYKVNKADIVGKKKNKEFVEPRQICCYLISEMMDVPTVTIGKSLGGRDHSTVIYSRDRIAELIKNDDKLRVQINDIKKMLLKQ